MVNVLGSDCVPVPFSDIVCEEGFIAMRLGLLIKFGEVVIQILLELFVKVLSKQMG